LNKIKPRTMTNKILLKKRFFVVIHTLTNGLDHAVKETKVAKENGADGVFLIHDYEKGKSKMATTDDQLRYVAALKKIFPDFMIGVNFLKNPAFFADKVYQLNPSLIQEDGLSVLKLNRKDLPQTELFCGVAFKYSNNVNLTGEKLKTHCDQIAQDSDVPTTSGDATGSSANLEKIREIRHYLPPEKRLGLASGVTEENIHSYLKAGVTDFLVATSLIHHVDENDFDILDPLKVSKLSEIIHSYN
jgi:predicted TIM-barrel enzyme